MLLSDNDYNRSTPEGHAYEQSPARNEQGCEQSRSDGDMRARVINYLARCIRHEHTLPRAARENAQYYYAGMEFFYEVTR